jgi:hypothetical protein
MIINVSALFGVGALLFFYRYIFQKQNTILVLLDVRNLHDPCHLFHNISSCFLFAIIKQPGDLAGLLVRYICSILEYVPFRSDIDIPQFFKFHTHIPPPSGGGKHSPIGGCVFVNTIVGYTRDPCLFS